jgi:DNA-binding transcriptional LysR family regulator
MSFRRGQLKYFVTVAEEGQITRAAKKLHIAQPALSQAIGQLESQLGVRLLERHARGVTLTSAGEVFLTKARTVLSTQEDAAAAARLLGRIAKGALEFGFLSTPPAVFAPQLFSAFTSAYPEVALSFHELSFPTGSTVDWLADVDVGLCFSPTPHADVDMQMLWQEPRALLLHRSHTLAGRRAVTVSEVIDEQFYGCHEAVDPVWAGIWTLDDHRGGPPSRLTSDRPINSLELIAAISSGRAIRAFSAITAATIERFLVDLVAVPLSDADPAVFSMAWCTSGQNPLVAAFADVAADFSRHGERAVFQAPSVRTGEAR